MSKIVSILLEWKYSPETFLEEPVLIEFVGGKLEIKEGVAEAVIEPDIFHANETIIDELTKKIESQLYAVQIMTHMNFELTKPNRTDVREDGKRTQYLEVESCVNTQCFGAFDIVVHDKYGNVLSDTKQERLDKRNTLASLIDKHRADDATLDQILKSHEQSIKDPANELVHLYEIIDALNTKLGPKAKVIKALDITNAEWDKIGKLANSLPLNQGRHRGKSVGALRDAEPDELKEARNSAILLIKKYLKYIERRQHH